MATVIPKVSRLSPHVVRVLGCNPGPMTLQGTNTYLVGTGSSRLLVDSGEGGRDEWKKGLQGVLQEEKCQVGRLLLTHWHNDHVGGAKEVVEMSESPVEVLKWPRREAKEPNALDGIAVVKLEDGAEVGVEGARLTVLHTPGHTSDHVVLHLKEENAVFTGDCILGEGTAVFESLHQYMKSLEVILALKPSRLYPGHGPVVEDPVPKIEFYINHRNEREQQILSQISRVPCSSMDIVKIVYKDTPEQLHGAANINVNHHLDKLMVEGKVVKEDGGWKLAP